MRFDVRDSAVRRTLAAFAAGLASLIIAAGAAGTVITPTTFQGEGDQEVSSGLIQQATVIVTKQTVPDDEGPLFAFTSTIPGNANFTAGDGQSITTFVDPGVYTATETVPAGWSLTDITCSGDTIPPNSSGAGNTATFNAQSGETINCVFTNTQHASLTVVKETNPASDPQDFDFDLTGSGLPADLDLDTDAGDATLPSQQTFNLTAAQLGAHTVVESAVAGWALTNLVCTGAGGDSSTDLGARSATLDIDLGENVVCTFTSALNASPTPQASLLNAATRGPGTDSPWARVGFAALLIGALGALALANARGVFSRR